MTQSLSDIPPERRPFEVRGTAKAFAQYRGDESIISGPAGTGKSRACLELIHQAAYKYPGMRALIVRKTRESLTESALVTWEDKVVLPGSPILEGASRRMRQAYSYSNGSTVVLGGLDKPSKVMSTEYDLIYVQEAIEISEGEWEALLTRVRNGAMPYQRLMGDTNPDRPKHWIRERSTKGKLKLFDSRHEDNPLMHDGKDWTEYGRKYLARLDALTGPRRERLRFGRWVQAEGLVHPDWNPTIHIVDRFKPPEDWMWFWSVDFGHTNPFVLQIWVEDHDGRLYRVWEIYKTKRIVEDHAAAVMKFVKPRGEWRMPKPSAIICDHNAEDRATLERHLKLPTKAATKDVTPGIDEVSARLRVQDDGKPRLFFMRDPLIGGKDMDLDNLKLPTCTEEEFDGYVWSTSSASRRRGEEPVKLHDHGMDATRYMVMYRVKSTARAGVVHVPQAQPGLRRNGYQRKW